MVVSQARPSRRPIRAAGTTSTEPSQAGSKVKLPNATGPEPGTPTSSVTIALSNSSRSHISPAANRSVPAGRVSRAASPQPTSPSPPRSQATTSGCGRQATRSPGSSAGTVPTARRSGACRSAAAYWALTADHFSSARSAPRPRTGLLPGRAPGVLGCCPNSDQGDGKYRMQTALRRVPAVPASRPVPGLISPMQPGRPRRDRPLDRLRPRPVGHRVRFSAGHRWYCRLEESGRAARCGCCPGCPGQQTGFHDHGEAAARSRWPRASCWRARPGRGDRDRQPGRQGRGPALVRPRLPARCAQLQRPPAVSVHAYSPPLSMMRRYEMTASGLALAATETAEADW